MTLNNADIWRLFQKLPIGEFERVNNQAFDNTEERKRIFKEISNLHRKNHKSGKYSSSELWKEEGISHSENDYYQHNEWRFTLDYLVKSHIFVGELVAALAYNDKVKEEDFDSYVERFLNFYLSLPDCVPDNKKPGTKLEFCETIVNKHLPKYRQASIKKEIGY